MTLVVTAATAGFCFGVRRAVQRVEALAREHRGQRVVTIGPLIHNADEVERLSRLGVVPASAEEAHAGDILVTRTHGATVELMERLEARGEVHDATCPYVSACQSRARRMAREGYAVVLVGDAGHPESEAILSHAAAGAAEARTPRPVCVVSSASEIARQPLGGVSRVAVLAQTTMVRETLKAVAGGCIERFREVRVMDTICDATARRQQEASQLARFAEAVVVIGGRESANTRHLVEVCSAIQPRTYHVQRASELRPEWLVPGGRVAITAGASTPATAISEVAERLRAMTGGQEKTA